MMRRRTKKNNENGKHYQKQQNPPSRVSFESDILEEKKVDDEPHPTPAPKKNNFNPFHRFSNKQNKQQQKQQQQCAAPPTPASPDEEELKQDVDPVIALFEARCKNRVRWALEDCPPSSRSPAPQQSNVNGTPDNSLPPSSTQKATPSSPTSVVIDSSSGSSSNGNLKNISSNSSSSNNLKSFMKGALFNNKNRTKDNEEYQKQAVKEVQEATGMDEDKSKSLVWESAHGTSKGDRFVGPEQIRTTKSQNEDEEFNISFSEDPQVRASVIKVLNKARRAQYVYFRYEHAVKYFVKAHELLTNARYPDNHPTVTKTLESLHHAHHALSSYNNSANIVKMGIKYEDSGELIRALKMYSIAYRIRRDNLSKAHPSLVVLLNMLGSLQIKRGDLEEAMQIYELALQDPIIPPQEQESIPESTKSSRRKKKSKKGANEKKQSSDNEGTNVNLLARSVTYREMGSIFDKWEDHENALKMYHKSLNCVADWRSSNGMQEENKVDYTALPSPFARTESNDGPSPVHHVDSLLKVAPSFHNDGDDEDDAAEKGEMEVFVAFSTGTGPSKPAATTFSYYDSFFPLELDADEQDQEQKSPSQSGRVGQLSSPSGAPESGKKPKATSGGRHRDEYADIDVALTIHQIAQLHRKSGEFNSALEAYTVSLRGMKSAVGNNHPNVAAILGNIGNLQKEMGDYDAAYNTYQEVLGIESYRLGLSHPDVAITLHNIATIDAARGNYDRSLTLYRQVLTLQEKLFGKDHGCVAVTAACMGDVYEQIGDMKNATDAFEEALRIKSATQGHHSLEVARMMHKLAKIAFVRNDFRMANSFISRAILVYRLNKITDDHQWAVDAHRDSADIDAAIAMGQKRTFEC